MTGDKAFSRRQPWRIGSGKDDGPVAQLPRRNRRDIVGLLDANQQVSGWPILLSLFEIGSVRNQLVAKGAEQSGKSQYGALDPLLRRNRTAAREENVGLVVVARSERACSIPQPV